ncbi:hypothetical protein EHF33_10855 [Deinococcus psychrotolerans]|uniref:Uncharacterized protein n=1 Tax=Deinococcus psychrotolerans TaxID=2489213 RepID=A0A3G8YDX2_9DEIO|nr:YbaY family lipoprotein [Deinococcus psychrotolerans]AZI43175.1 hypothetical protein EHF33_10855 [Deinococcus psychrotolerans]
MKIFSLFAATLLLSAAPTTQAQTVINGVTITKPGQKAAAPARRTVPAFVDQNIPADWVDVRGRVATGSAGRTDLPAGSKVTVELRDITVPTAAKTLVSTTFPSASLPVSYQIVSSPRRFTSSGQYAVRVSVNNAAGKLIYSNTVQQLINPAAKRILADVRVSAP